MKIFICRATDFNYTLIPYTDMEIVKATHHFFPNARDHFFGADPSADQKFLQEMHDCYQSGQPMLSLNTDGKIGLHKTAIPVERKRLSYFSDAPYEFLEYVQPMPAGSYPTYTDRSFKQFYDDSGWDLNPIFCPHGGPINVKRGKPMADRKYPISFVGYIRNPNPIGAFENLLAGSDPRLIDIVRKASQMNLHEGIEAYMAFRYCALEAGFHPWKMMELSQLGTLLNKMGHWAEEQRRLQLLRALKDFPLHIFGPVVEEVEGVTDQPHHQFYGPTMGKDVLEVLKESRILLNTVTKFPDGSHERIWFAMAHGCMPYTDPSRYVMETFTDRENILYIDYENLDQSAGQVMSYATDNVDELQKIMDAAIPVYEQNHTWLHRLESVYRQIPETAPFIPVA